MSEPLVVIVDAHPLYRSALAVVLGIALPRARQLEAAALEQAQRQWQDLPPPRQPPGLLVLDWALPTLRGAALVEHWRGQFPGCPVLVVSDWLERGEMAALGPAAAVTCLPKQAHVDVLAECASDLLAGRALPDWRHAAKAAPALSPRQAEVLHLVCQGSPNKIIAARLELAEATVKMHVSALFQTLGVRNRSQAIVAAQRLGL